MNYFVLLSSGNGTKKLSNQSGDYHLHSQSHLPLGVSMCDQRVKVSILTILFQIFISPLIRIMVGSIKYKKL